LAKEARKPQGFLGHVAYASIKGNEFDDLIKQEMTAEDFAAYTASIPSQAKSSSFSEFWKKTQ
jgi:hypothetical protein